MTSFETILDQIRRDGDQFLTNPSADWRQGRTLFGGLSAALCHAACDRMVPDLPPLRAGQIAFIGPSVGEARLVPTVLRRGKSVTFMGCDLIADGQVATRAIFTFGDARVSSLDDGAPRAPGVAAPEACQPLWGDQKPSFTVHLDQRLAGGHRPGSGADKGDMIVWVRHVEPVPPSFSALIALGDALPPASFSRTQGPVMISTMTWAFDLFDPDPADGTGWVLMRSTDDGVGGGYAGQAMGMWREDGSPILVARQSVAIFD